MPAKLSKAKSSRSKSNHDQRAPGVVRIFDMGLELLDDKQELLLALEASTTNLRTAAEFIEDDVIRGLIQGNCEANARTIAKVRGATN